MRITIIIFALGVTLCSCGKEENLNDYMIGKWETKMIDVTLETPNRQDTTVRYVVDYEDEMDPRASVKARSEYINDGTFKSWYVDAASGEESPVSEGTWSVNGNELTVDYSTNGLRINPTYTVEITDVGFKAESSYDWDNDGQKDDFLIMESKKVENFE